MPRAVCHVALGGLPLRRRLRQRGFGLRHVGPGDLADTEPVVGRLELLCQHLLVVDGERQKLLRLDHADLDLGRGDRRRRADIGDHRVDEAGLLLRDQVGALRHHLVLGAVHVGLCLAARVDGLGQRRLCGADQPVGLRGQRAAAARPGERAAHAVAVAGGSRHHDGGPPARQRLRHVLVGGPQLRPLGQQRRLVGVGQCEGLGQRMRRARLRRGATAIAGTGFILAWATVTRLAGRASAAGLPGEACSPAPGQRPARPRRSHRDRASGRAVGPCPPLFCAAQPHVPQRATRRQELTA